jgi:hypothetical protein
VGGCAGWCDSCTNRVLRAYVCLPGIVPGRRSQLCLSCGLILGCREGVTVGSERHLCAQLCCLYDTVDGGLMGARLRMFGIRDN